MRRHKPNVPALLNRGDLEGLVEAASFREVKRDFDGRPVDEGEQIREHAVLALGELGAEAGNGTVAAALRDPRDSVRSAAVRVLYSRQEVDSLTEALSWLPPNSGSSRSLACHAILQLRASGTARKVARALVRFRGSGPLTDTDVAFLHTLMQPTRQIRPVKGVVRELVIALASQRDEVADRAEELLVRLAAASTKTVIGELERGRSPERAAAILGRIGDSRALQPLLHALEHRRAGVRVQAAGALGKLRDPAAVEALLRATRDPELDVRAEASHALDQMGAAAVIVGMSALMRPMIAEAVGSSAPRSAPRELAPGVEIDAPGRVGPFLDALEDARVDPARARVPGTRAGTDDARG